VTPVGIAICVLWFGATAVQALDVLLSVRNWRRTRVKVSPFLAINAASCILNIMLIVFLTYALRFHADGEQFAHRVLSVGGYLPGGCVSGAAIVLLVLAYFDKLSSLAPELRLCGPIATMFSGFFLGAMANN
jgi:hypothetical protein